MVCDLGQQQRQYRSGNQSRLRSYARQRSGPSADRRPLLSLQRALGNQASAGVRMTQEHDNDLVRAAGSAPTSGSDHNRNDQAAGAGSTPSKGEVAGELMFLMALKGEPEDGGSGDGGGMKGEGVKKVKKTELAAPSPGDCGSYSWRVRFSVENADASTNGYIVQKVNAVYKRSECDGTNKPVTGIGTFPFWEAWGVRGGKVYIGDTANEHNADTYSDDNMGDATRGSIAVNATAEFYPNVKLPDHMKANNPDTQAGDLRSSTTDPKLSGGTGSIPHDLTASWDCCPGSKSKKTTFSNKN